MSELELVAHFQTGDLSAYESLMRQESARLLGFVNRYVRSPDVAEDIYQEVALRVWRNRSSLRNRGKFRSWLYQIARNAIYDHLHGNDWRMEVDLYGDEGDANWVMDTSRDPRERAQLEEWSRIVSEELRTLDSTDQEMIVLHFSAGLNLREVAETLNMKHSTLRSRMCRVLRQLRGKMSRRGIDAWMLNP